MISSFLFAGLLPLVAAEACSSVIAKTHLVTSVVTTIEYTTLPSDPSCTVSHALPSEPPSSDKPATSSEPTFEWTAPAPPEGTDFEWLPTLEPTPPGPDVTAPTDVIEPPATTDVVEPSASTEVVEPSSSTCTTDEEKPVTTSSPPASETSPEEQSTTCTTDISESTEVSSVPHTSAAPSDSSASTTAPGKTSATASDEEPCTTSTAEGVHTSAGESASATSGKDESEVTSTASEDTSEPTSTPAEETPATTTSAEEDSEATTTSAEETSEATTTSAEESSDATTSPAEETPEATTPSAEESSEATTTSAEETSEATTSAEESAEPTASAEESSVTSASETSEEPKTTESPSTFSSVVITTSAASSEASTSSEVSTTSTSTTSEAPKETKLPRNYPADIVDELQDESIEKLKKWLSENNSNGCTLEKASIRREWGDLTLAQREDYIGAVLCLQSEPSRYAGEIPGAKSRFDDFVVTHQSQTGYIHGTANFLTWHRYFLHEFEKALKNECGYKGVMPYWNWDRYANDPENSPLFNGDAGSLGGNAGPSGCVENGPFKDYKVSLGPGASTRYNPRCLQRDMSKVAARYTKVDVTYPLITQSNNVGLFQDRIQSGNNVHAAGHHTVGGNPGADIYTSPGDPYFHLHHAGVDRLFWIWQLQDLNSRLSQVAGQNPQTRRAGSLTETMNLGRNAGDVQLGSLLNTMGGLDGGLCYIYY